MQVFVGDEVGVEVHKNQPLKTAAIEGIWDNQKGAPLVLFAYPSESQEKNLFRKMMNKSIYLLLESVL